MLDDDRRPNQDVLTALPIFPLPNAVLLPGMVLPLNVFEPRYLDLVDHALARGPYVAIPLLRPGFEAEYGGRPPVESIAGLGRLLTHQRLPDGRRFIRVEGLGRVRFKRELEPRARFREVDAELLPEAYPADQHELDLLRATVERIASTLEADDEDMVRCILRIPDARMLVYAIASILPTLGLLSPLEEVLVHGRCPHLDLQQRCLAACDADDRVRLLLGRSSTICDVLGESGRFPRTMMN